MAGRGSFFVAWLASVSPALILSLFGCLPVDAAEPEPLAARQEAARTLVKEALQREIYGPFDERQALLQHAQERDTVSLPARWHQGLVQTPTGAWARPDEFSLDPKSKSLLAEYRKVRDATADTASAQLGLANWCAEHKLPQQERAHLWRVLTIESEHPEARRRLGFVQVDKEWVTAEDAAAEQQALAEHAEALAKYREPVQEILRDLTHRSLKRQQMGRQAIDELADPAALPAVEEILGPVGGHISELAIEKIDNFEGQDAAVALCRFALFAPQEQLRKLATAKLRNRDRNDYVPLLLDLLSRPLESRYVAVAFRNGLTNYQHVVVREGRSRRDVMVMNRQFLTQIEATPENGNPQANRSRPETRKIDQAASDAEIRDGLRDAARLSAERELQLQQANAMIDRVNRLVIAVLSTTTDQQYVTPDAWWQWWLNESDREQNSKRTTFAQQYTSKIVWSGNQKPYPQQPPAELPKYQVYKRYRLQPIRVEPFSISCFAAGTLVWTVDGTVPIESLKLGDMVLAKDIETGELCYKPVLETTVRPPSPIIAFKAGSDTFRTSKGHLFWHSGAGWTQARRLQPGMMLHSAADPVRVSETAEEGMQPTYNLVVADFSTYFVGQEKVLTHDVTEEEPTDVIVPGLPTK